MSIKKQRTEYGVRRKIKCPVHGVEIVSEKEIPFNRHGDTVQEPIFYCHICSRYYIHTDLAPYGSRFDYGDKTVINTPEETYSSDDKNIRKYSIAQIRPSVNRKKTADIARQILSYEDCEKNYDTSYPFSLLHYAFVFRRFDMAENILNGFNADSLREALHFTGPDGYEWITPLVCAKWNLNYIWAYDDRNNAGLGRRLEEYFNEVEQIDELMEYTDSIDGEDNDVFTVFWDCLQPMLDVIFFEKQMVASLQVARNGFSVVMDEVGTGKTVSALYAMRDIIQIKAEAGVKTRILVVCPYNKREDWQNDIRRQLGRYAHIVEQGDNGDMYRGDLKKVFFKGNEHIIMIAGQSQGNDLNGSHSALKGSIQAYSDSEKWDMVIIDEAHILFDNYSDIAAERVMLLTATPIVVNSKGKRTYDDYIGLISKILNKPVGAVIDPINRYVPDAEDNYVNWFREDMGKSSIERKIRFVSCKRWADRENAFNQIRDKKGILTALQYDQDDDYLYWVAVNKYSLRDIREVRKNEKMECLVSLLHENDKSFIIFCEHQFVADGIFQKLKGIFAENVVAEKCGRHENQYGLDNVQSGLLVNTLTQALRDGKRVLFVTTGKTGGTGLNLGEFDGIIHYELPFTSIELEQRFGRVDRIDTLVAGNVKDMIFLLNECGKGENDMETNRMLYYCTTKIDITCQFMPIRNTVLYYPEFIRRNGRAIRESLMSIKKQYVLSEENESRIWEIHRTIIVFQKRITDDPLWTHISFEDKNIRLCALAALSNVRDDRIPEQYYELLSEYLTYWKTTKAERATYQKAYRSFLEARKNAYNWLAIIGLAKVEKGSDIFAAYEQRDDNDEKEIPIQYTEVADNRTGRSKRTIQRQISEIIGLIDQHTFDDDELKNFSSQGIFCYKDGMIKRSSVNDYRHGNGWD